MTTRAIGGLNSSEEREGQQMVPAHGRNNLPKFRKQMHGPDRRNLQLRFQSMLPDSFFTKRKVEGKRGAPIHVKLIDTSTGHVVRSGPESCVKLKVVVVEGDFNNEDDDDWIQEDFESRIVKEREGKSPLLTGELHVHLKEGVGSLGKLSFTDNSSWTRSKKFRVGLKVASGLREGIRVLEAITNPFDVKDCRGEVYKKHDLPALDDEVWRLKKIKKNGPFQVRLNDNGIFIVEDFLWLLGTDPKGLRKILGSGMREKMWDALVQHAKTCDLRGKHYVYYADNTKNFGVVFKSICELSGYIAGGKYYSAETLSDSQKVLADTFKNEAYAKWKDIVEYDGLLPLEMNPRLVNPGTAVGVAGGLHGFFNHTVECGSSSSVLSENYESGSRTSFGSIGDMVSVPKCHVYYADNTKNSGVVFKIISDQLCGLIEGGEYYSAKTLSDSQKVSLDTLMKKPYENRMDVMEYDGRMLLNMKQSERASSSRTEVVIEAPADYHVSLDQQVSLPHLPSSVPSEQTFMNSVVAVGGGVGYDENFGNRYPVRSHRSNAQMQLESNTVGRQMQLVSSSHQSQITRNDHMSQPESASCFGFQSIGSSGLSSNLISYDDRSAGYNNNRGADEEFSEEQIREMIENVDMQPLLRVFSTGAAPANASDDGYPYSPYTQPPPTTSISERIVAVGHQVKLLSDGLS
ncbi:hypothetical protein AAC387_Pa03g0165 [Persea americana]